MTKRSKVVDQYIDIGYLLDYLQCGVCAEEALYKIGRNKKWYYDVKRRYPKLQEAIKQAEKEWDKYIQAMLEFVETINSVEEVESPEYNWEDDYNYEEPKQNILEQIILTSLVFIWMLDVIMILYILYMVATM